MTLLQFTQASGKTLKGATLEFGPGLHVITSNDGEALEEFFAFVSGVTTPRSGKVLLRDTAPHRCPLTRAHIGTVWPKESLAEGHGQAGTLKRLGLPQERVTAVEQQLKALGLYNTLDAGIPHYLEAHLLYLGLALCTPEPWLLVVHEPFIGLRDEAQALVLEELLRHSAQLPVVVTSASHSVATRLGGATWTLQGGFFRRVVHQATTLQRIDVWGIGLRSLVGDLSKRPTLRSLRLEVQPNGQEFLTLLTSSPRELSLEVSRLSVTSGARILSLNTSQEPV